MNALDVIKAKDGYADFQRLIEKWDNLSGNLSTLPKGAPVILPDIFLDSKSGSGRTLLIKMLSDFLVEKKNLLDFYGDVRYFEFYLSYCHPGESFAEIVRFMDEVRCAAGFRSEYRGIIFIHVDEWLGHCEERHFINFLEYLADNSDGWLIVLSVDGSENEAELTRLRSVVSAFLRIEQVHIAPPTPVMLLQYLEERIALCGLTLDESAKAVLSESINIIRDAKHFDGFNTIKMMSYDIAYSVYSESGDIKGVLDAKAVKRFARDGEYVKVMCHKLAKHGIGF